MFKGTAKWLAFIVCAIHIVSWKLCYCFLSHSMYCLPYIVEILPLFLAYFTCCFPVGGQAGFTMHSIVHTFYVVSTLLCLVPYSCMHCVFQFKFCSQWTMKCHWGFFIMAFHCLCSHLQSNIQEILQLSHFYTTCLPKHLWVTTKVQKFYKSKQHD